MDTIKKLLDAIDSSRYKSGKITGVKDGEKALIIALAKRAVIFCAEFVSAVKIKRCLTALGKKCHIISNGREPMQGDDQNLTEFASCISDFVSKQADYIIMLPQSMMTKFDLTFFSRPVSIEKNAVISPQTLAEKLVELGYSRVSLVASAGEFALRGDIFDIFPAGEQQPIRIDFFDEIVENIAFFDVSNMKITQKIENYQIYPVKLPLGKNVVSDLSDIVIADQEERIEGQMSLARKSLSVMTGFKEEDYAEFSELKITQSFALSGQDLLTGAENSYVQNYASLADDLKHLESSDRKVVLFAGDDAGKNRLKNFLLGQEISYFDFEESDFIKPGIYVSSFYYPSSFNFPYDKIVAIGSDNLSKPKHTLSHKAKKDAFYQPRIGEYVVHEYHGIGKCTGIERMNLAGCEKDYFVIEYRGGGMLYLPSEQASSLAAYVGEENPRMNALGGHEFELMKSRVKQKLEGFAIDLMAAYKEREESKGYAFSSQPFLENAFASAFEYEETQDQAQAINEIFSDMTSNKVMDRLLCGDVGFGKTEVAYRAAFKAVINSKQVAFLCPTTILSEQHYKNAVKRMSDFGVNIEVLNRFKKPSEVKLILEKLKQGKVDILIGTHKILSKNVEFKDLGLLIIDEEQRFGVADKEKIKLLKKNIDVLALSATPIPRSLHMSLSGIRDISVITTPPADRLPIQTYVTPEDDELVASVLAREIARGGTSFVIYNRVASIDHVAARISDMLPQAKVGVAHGQMSEVMLGRVIDRLYKGEYNVFVSTTLIENGIDLPSANTMVIYNADLLGLSALYQLRGRIGRSDKLSYAYLLYKGGKVMTEEAYKRLEAIQEFRELGSGFKISMRDLEIRGAGNIFGKAQHGHIEKVGYDMYVKLLSLAIDEIQGKAKVETKPVKIEIPIDAYISQNYITDSEQRIDYYVKISEAENTEQMQQVISSLKDGYGDVPSETIALAKIALIKNLCGLFNIVRVRYDGAIKLEIDADGHKIDNRLIGELGKYGASLSFGVLPIIKLPKTKSLVHMLDDVIELLEHAKAQKS